MEYRYLGNTPYLVSRFCFGTLTSAPIAASLTAKETGVLIRAALERGVNFIDTAQYYRNYHHVREGLDSWSGEVIVATKSFANTYEKMTQAIEEARRALNRDKIEIFLLHQVESQADYQSRLPGLECLCDAKAKGLVGAVGLSTHAVAGAWLAAQKPEIEVLHPMINIDGTGIIDGGRNDMLKAIRSASENGKGVYAMKVLAGGGLGGKAREAIRWAAAEQSLHALAIGIKTLPQLVTDIGWMSGEEPAEAALVELEERVMQVAPYCRGCGKCLSACHQKAIFVKDFRLNWLKEKCVYCGYCVPACGDFCITFH
ncbi:MAG: aldo/keto reductase [Clostridiales bacterium]|nr:aldo/keto reductase [Clostridiales bacterium]